MTDAMTYLLVAGAGIAALGIALFAALRGWEGWLALKRLEISGGSGRERSPAMERIELADLKERVRKLETIAACVDL